MNYRLYGRGDKLIVFLHGFGGGFESFQGVADRLQMRYKCLLISFFDAEPTLPLGLDDYCDYVETVLDIVMAKEVILVGHSFGGRVAIRLASRGVGDKLILVDSAGLRPHRGLRYYYRVYKYKLKRRLGYDVSREGSSDYRALSPVMKRTFINIVNTYQESELQLIKIPTMIIWGGEDRETPLDMAEKLNREIPSSTLIVYKGAGHYSYIYDMDRFVNNIRSFCG